MTKRKATSVRNRLRGDYLVLSPQYPTDAMLDTLVLFYRLLRGMPILAVLDSKDDKKWSALAWGFHMHYITIDAAHSKTVQFNWTDQGRAVVGAVADLQGG